MEGQKKNAGAKAPSQQSSQNQGKDTNAPKFLLTKTGILQLEKANSEAPPSESLVLHWLAGIGDSAHDFQEDGKLEMYQVGAALQNDPALGPSDSQSRHGGERYMATADEEPVIPNYLIMQEYAKAVKEDSLREFEEMIHALTVLSKQYGGAVSIPPRAMAQHSEAMKRMVRTYKDNVRQRISGLILQHRGAANIPLSVIAALTEAEQRVMSEHLARVNPKDAKKQEDES